MLLKFIFIVIAITILIGLYVYYEVHYPDTVYININTDKIPLDHRLKILQISDYHDSPSIDIKERVLSILKAERPDLVVITGDLLDERRTVSLKNIDLLVTEMAEINNDIYFVTGNHEWGNRNKNTLIKRLNNLGIRVLNNSSTVFEKENIQCNIVGIDDFYTHHSDLRKAFDGVDKSLYTILLSHAPDVAWREKPPVDIILSGHTHGGQIRFPLLGAIIAPGQGLMPRYDKGLFHMDNKFFLYIDSGLGTSRIPVRFLNRSQISVITIGNS